MASLTRHGTPLLALVCALAVLHTPLDALADRRRRRTRSSRGRATATRRITPPAPPPAPAPPRLTVLRTRGIDPRATRARASQPQPAIERCIALTQRTDPAGLSLQPAAEARLVLRADGSVETVELSPSRLAQGLSACLASALLAWQQPGRVSPRGGALLLAVRLTP